MNDHDDQHFRKFPPHPGANAYAMNDVMNVHRAIHDRVHGYDVYDDQMNEANVVDELDADFELDDDNAHIRNGFHRRNVDDTYYYMTEVLWPSSATELIVDLNYKIRGQNSSSLVNCRLPIAHLYKLIMFYLPL